MSVPIAGHTITRQCDYAGHIRTSLEVEDIGALPTVVKKLIDMGFDLSKTAEAIKEATEKQQQAKQAESLKEKRKQAAQAGIARDPAIQRFIIAYNKKGSDEIKTAQGSRLGNGGIAIEDSAEFPIGGSVRDEGILKRAAERFGYEYHIEYMD